VKDGTVTLELTRDDLLVTANALSEIVHGLQAIEGSQFQTRIGFDRDQAHRLPRRVAQRLGGC
jgi:hypothetical protein